MKRTRVGLGDFEGLNRGRSAEVVLAAALLPVVEVGVATLGAHDLAALRELHALDGALLRLHLRHFRFPFFVLAGRAAFDKPDPDGIGHIVYTFALGPSSGGRTAA